MSAVQHAKSGLATGATLCAAQSRDAQWLAERTSGSMPKGAVLFHAPVAAFQAPGGGENQLLRTGWHLERLGIRVRPLVPWVDRLEDARLLHLFGMSREGLALARVARARGVKVVLSPICWFEPKALARLASNGAGAAAAVSKWSVRRIWPACPGWRRELLQLCDAILPNSSAEARQLTQLFGMPEARMHVVPNGVERRFLNADASLFRSHHGPEPCVLYVGRIEPRKNVLGLVRAARACGLPLVAIGDPVPGHERYHALCLSAGGARVRFLGSLPHDDPLLASAYAAARVFALPSWFETPGLAALEAALAGCAVVITPYGCTREYFGTRVAYARPDRPKEIARALTSAWDRGPDSSLPARVAERYLWTAVARKTAEVYDALCP
jgi:glycosyltransferase involved in cell wall biosynthesis